MKKRILLGLLILGILLISGCVPKKEYAEFDLTFDEKEMSFQAKTILVSERTSEESIPYILISLFGESSSAPSFEEIIKEIEEKEKESGQSKGIVQIIIIKLGNLPKEVICNLGEYSRLCDIYFAEGTWQLSEPYGMDSGKATFHFRQEGTIEGEIDTAHYDHAFIFGKFQVKYEALPTPKTAADCEKIKDSFSRDSCYATFARETKNASLCGKIAYSLWKDECYYDIALDTKDFNLCEKIKESWKMDACYANTMPEIKDASLCEKITTSWLKSGCYYNIAIKTKDASLCEKIADSTKKGYCYTETA